MGVERLGKRFERLFEAAVLRVSFGQTFGVQLVPMDDLLSGGCEVDARCDESSNLHVDEVGDELLAGLRGVRVATFRRVEHDLHASIDLVLRTEQRLGDRHVLVGACDRQVNHRAQRRALRFDGGSK